MSQNMTGKNLATFYPDIQAKHKFQFNTKRLCYYVLLVKMFGLVATSKAETDRQVVLGMWIHSRDWPVVKPQDLDDRKAPEDRK